MVGTIWDVVIGGAVDDDVKDVVGSRTGEVVEITDVKDGGDAAVGGAIDVSKESSGSLWSKKEGWGYGEGGIEDRNALVILELDIV